MNPTRLLATFALLVPATAALLAFEALAMRTAARRPARAGERPGGERHGRIGPGWRGGLLRAAGVEGEVEAIALERIGEVGQMSAVYRVDVTYRPGPSGPASLVVKTTAPELRQRVLNAGLGVFAAELRAYRLPAPTRGLLRPRLWYGEQRPVSRASLLVLDDLSRWRGMPADGKLTRADALRVAAALGEQHAAWWGRGEELRARGFPCASGMIRASVGPMCALGWSRGRALMAGLVDRASLALLGQIVRRQAAIGRRLDAEPQTLVHGDLNANNLFFDDAGGRVCAIDWQASRSGSWAEDLAYVAVMSMHADACAEAEEALLAAHREAMAAGGVELSPAAHASAYALGLFQAAAILVVAGIIIDPRRSPTLFEQYRGTIGGWAAAARRHRLRSVLAEVPP